MSFLEVLESSLPASLEKFDAFPKLPSSYKARTSSGGIFSIGIILLCFLLTLNDVGEYFFGWPDQEFSMEYGPKPKDFMKVNVDVIVGMPCRYISIDLRDAIGDRLMLTGGLRRDGTKFDTAQATKLKEHSAALSSNEVIHQARHSRGFFGGWFTGLKDNNFKPTYDIKPHGAACRVWGTFETKKVTANLHITTLGHGYASPEHIDHSKMNMSHIINEFSFGPHFPAIVQPLDNSFELTHETFVAYQYFVHVVPTTYIAAPSFASSLVGLFMPIWGIFGREQEAVDTNQYSVTHYTRVLEHGKGTPGIFFKFEVDPVKITIIQRTTSLFMLAMRVVGVVGGVITCMTYFYRVSSKAIAVVTGDEGEQIVDPQGSASGAKAGLRAKWGGSNLRSRPQGRMVPQGSGWVMEGSPGSATLSSYSPYTSTPTSSQFPSSPYTPTSGYPVTPNLQVAMNTSLPPTPATGQFPTSAGLGINSAGFPPGSPLPGIGFPSSPSPGSQFGNIPPPPRSRPTSMHIRSGSIASPTGGGHIRSNSIASQSGGYPSPSLSPSPNLSTGSGKKDD
ncbi:endoplasmic reticulum vesicle transporter-domain-containing protein [Flagelloscypha sp. PMI_526]|nr:endoplasmic reticulum vesicle transporter-domain-containing protein [Flagelloscypha sp. PMI_526]